MPRLTKPKPGEPIRLINTRGGEPRFQVVLTSTPRGTKKRQQVRRNFQSLAAARAFVDKTRVAVRAGSFHPTTTITLEELAEQWLETRRDIRAITIEGYRTVLRPLMSAHGDRQVQSITRHQIEQWVGSWRTTGGLRRQGLSHRSIVYALGALHQVLDHAVAQGMLTRNPADGVKAPRKRAEDHHKTVIWTPDELDKFLRTADGDEWAAAWRLSACGLRRSEVLGMTWAAVNWNAGEVEVQLSRVKTGKARTTAIDDPKSAASRRKVPVESAQAGTMAALKALRSSQAEQWLAAGGRWASDLVMVDAAGQGIHPDAYSRRFRDVCLAADVPQIKLHSIRHTIASALHDAGVPPAAAARFLGHTLATHIAYYVKSSDDSANRAAVRFGAIMAAARSS